eukprot:scaffold5407_cov96-Isochrysis_galbana.AAC.1
MAPCVKREGGGTRICLAWGAIRPANARGAPLSARVQRLRLARAAAALIERGCFPTLCSGCLPTLLN